MVCTGKLSVYLVVSQEKKQGFKKHFAFILVHVSPSWIIFQPPCTGNSLLVPSSRISNCSITKVTPKKQRDTTVLQETGLPDPLPFITACPRPPHFQSILVSFSCILCQTDLYLTLQEVYAQEPQWPTADVRNEGSSPSQKRKDMPGMQREKGQMCGVAGCQICSLFMLWSPEAEPTEASGN